MRINNIGTSVVTAPEVRPQVGAVRGTAPTGQRAASPRVATASAPFVSPESPRVTAVERRRTARRGDDRRKQQAAVLIDTRVSQRRRTRRRRADAPPNSVDADA